MAFDKKTYNREYQREYRKKNREKVLSSLRDYGKRKRDDIRAYDRERYRKNPDYFREKQRRLRAQLRQEFLDAYGNKCQCCGEDTPVFLTLEHLNNDGAEHRRSLPSNGSDAALRDLRQRGWPKDGYAIMCWNCNMARRSLGSCPHQVAAPQVVE